MLSRGWKANTKRVGDEITGGGKTGRNLGKNMVVGQKHMKTLFLSGIEYKYLHVVLVCRYNP
jgi:hypothetical protein